MNYTQQQVKLYRQLLKSEFTNESLILIKDPRLTFFVDFLKEVCNDYEYFFFFVKDNKKHYFEMQYEPFAESTKKLKSTKKNTKWINKVISGQQPGRHQRTTILYKPVFYLYFTFIL